MTLFEDYGLHELINARGVFTPLGVSRTPEPIIEAVAEALRHFFDMAELQEATGRTIAEIAGCEWGAVTNCAAASITISVAAVMAGTDAEKIARLPDTTGMADRVVIQAGHLVDYGQPIEQAIRLAGAEPVVAGTAERCTPQDLETALKSGNVAALVVVDSRLNFGETVPPAQAVALAHAAGLPAILDGAAQDLRLDALIATGADLIAVSAQKYLSGPTAGLVFGKRALVDAVNAQGKGIGRGMKAGKEAVFGALAALKLRQTMDLAAWETVKTREAEAFAARISGLAGVATELVPDPTKGPFCRVHATIDAAVAGKSAGQVISELGAGERPIFVYAEPRWPDTIVLELMELTEAEREAVAARLEAILA
ncbi:MAG: beta-eliminating lyase-related protein [Hyphomicrobiales bacterium]|nr:beta-eliminating lyase-related protein [Hyphomicrobiales bacterium]